MSNENRQRSIEQIVSAEKTSATLSARPPKRGIIFAAESIAFLSFFVASGALMAKSDKEREAEQAIKEGEAERKRNEVGRKKSERDGVARGARPKEEVKIKKEEGKEPPL